MTCLFKLFAFGVEDIKDVSLVNGLLLCRRHDTDEYRASYRCGCWLGK